VIALVARIAVSVTLLAWTLVLVLEEPLVVAIVVTALAALTVLALFVAQRLRDRRGAHMLATRLRAEADAAVATVRPDMSLEIGSMREQFLGSLSALRSSKLGKSGYDALYAMPWYMIVGPPGCGKTTAIYNSGLQFPFQPAGGAIRGVGGTRNCQWWLANEAVLLDTAGRYTTEDDDRDEWLAFLDLLRTSRPRKPIEGVLVAIGIDELGGLDDEQIVARARALRARIDEIMGRLDMVAPVYVLFTKCDLIPGFVESFGDLSRSERAQVWGFTAPLARRDVATFFRERFGALVESTREYVLRRLPRQRQLAARVLAHGMPEQLRAVGPALTTFVEHLFTENVYQETPLLRGVYFTSGTQDGRPIDRLISSMTSAFGITQAAAAATQERKSFFLGDVFTRVVFPDQRLAVRSTRELRRQRLATLSGALTLLVLAGSLFTLAGASYTGNTALQQQTRELVASVASERPPEPPPALRRLLAELERHHADGPPTSMRLGMYCGEDLRRALLRLVAALRGDRDTSGSSPS
jgi:type VI secretion system protein ImpL